MTALALRDDQDYWDDKQLAVLHQTGIDDDVTKPELAAFLHECQRRKLDPFIRQIYLLGRWDKKKKRKVYRSQTSIDGFRLIARRAADKAHIDYGYQETIWFDPKGGRHEVWLAADPPAAVKVVVVRNGQPFDAVAKYAEYVQVNNDGDPMGMWKSMPAGQLAKCAEALALRKAFPEDLGGLYTEEEMAQADNPQTVHATAEVVHNRHEIAPPPADVLEGTVVTRPAQPQEDLDKTWQSDDAPEAKTDLAWLGHALERAVKVTERNYKNLWAEVAQAAQNGVLDNYASTGLQGVIQARMTRLRDKDKAEVVTDMDAMVHICDDLVPAATTQAEIAGLLIQAAELEASGKLADEHVADVRKFISERQAEITEPAGAAA